MRCLQDYYDFYHKLFIIKQFEFYGFDGRYKCRTGTPNVPAMVLLCHSITNGTALVWASTLGAI